jgi:hypothetical protein
MNLGIGKGQDLFSCKCRPIMASESIATNAPSNGKKLTMTHWWMKQN